MGFLSVLSMAQLWVRERLRPGDAAIDATAGNGNDTLFLARTASAGGRVYAFDVQHRALENTKARLAGAKDGSMLAEVELIHAGHERMAEYIPPALHGNIRAVMFNLGYLPGSENASIITRTDTTLAAMETAIGLLASGGVLTAVLYPGHPGGDEEAAAVERWASEQPRERVQTALYRFPQKPSAPFLIALDKR